MPANLLIVESPNKTRKLSQILGKDFRVIACMGHVCDLPTTELGLDIAADFAPQWQPLPSKSGVIKRLVKAMQTADTIYLATDPDREGEAIAAHVLDLTPLPATKPIYRVTFNAITASVVQAAIANPRPVDRHLVAAQHARRKLDRLVGYLVSPLACRHLDGRYSAGRVQSPALRLVVERERARQTFQPTTYYRLLVQLQADGSTFTAPLTYLQGQSLPLQGVELVQKLTALLSQAVYWVGDIQTETLTRQPPAPFTTSTLQQAASTRLGLAPEETMRLAQGLYETALITYMRTDGVHVAPEAQTAALDWIGHTYGEAYLPTQKPTYARRPQAQEAHEAIRPTDLTLTPHHLKGKSGKGADLYRLIWERFLASQMAAGVDHVQIITLRAGKQVGQAYPLHCQVRPITPHFLGFRQVYQADLEEEAEAPAANLPLLRIGQALTLVAVKPTPQQTTPPARYTEAQLVHELEQRGLGRPSTYAPILSNLKSRDYVRVEDRRLVPTPTGIHLTDYLQGAFATLFSDGYTARLERALDEIATGQQPELAVLQSFWAEFQPLLRAAAAELPPPTPKPTPLATGDNCPQCGQPLVYRTSSQGQFVGCAGYPQCRYTVGLTHQPLQLVPLVAE